MNLIQKTENHEFDTLIADTSFPINVAIQPIAGGQGVLMRGSVLGMAADKAVLVGSGTETVAEFILADDVDTGDAAEGSVNAQVYVSGAFNRFKLILGGTDKVEAHEKDLKEVGIYLKAVL